MLLYASHVLCYATVQQCHQIITVTKDVPPPVLLLQLALHARRAAHEDDAIPATRDDLESVARALPIAFGRAVVDELRRPGLKDSVAERPNHSNLCRSEFRHNSVKIQEISQNSSENLEM